MPEKTQTPGRPDRLAALVEKRRQIDAQIELLQARRTAAARKAEDRRRVILGAFLLKELRQNGRLRAYVQSRLADHLHTERDRCFMAGFLDGSYFTTTDFPEESGQP